VIEITRGPGARSSQVDILFTDTRALVDEPWQLRLSFLDSKWRLEVRHETQPVVEAPPQAELQIVPFEQPRVESRAATEAALVAEEAVAVED
jgi:hypothetical protein